MKFVRFIVAFTATTLSALASTTVNSPPFFVEGWFENTLANNNASNALSIAIWAGGNAGPYPDPGGIIPSAQVKIGETSVTVFLTESAIGQTVAGALGYPDALKDLQSYASQQVIAGAGYRFIDFQTGKAGLQGGAWNILFPGVIDPLTGTNWTSNSASHQNYFENFIREAERAYRAALRINPFDAGSAIGLIETFSERIIPLSFAANNAFVFATRKRLVGSDDPLSGEQAALNNAMTLYRQAGNVVVEALNNPADALLLEGLSPWISTPATQDAVSRLYTSFVRSLAFRAEALLRQARLKYLSIYSDPTSGAFDPTPVLALIDSNISEIQAQMLLANAFRWLPGFNQSQFTQTEDYLNELNRLRGAVKVGRLVFVGTMGGNSGTVTYSDYPPEYVPFLFDPLQFSQYKNSFDKISANALDFAGQSADMDAAVLTELRTFDSDTAQLQSRLGDIQSRYGEELADLCGTIRDMNGQYVADIFFAPLPASVRDAVGNSVLGNGKYVRGLVSGKIYEQWQAIESALTELQAAQLDLTNTYSAMQEKQKVANQITQGQENIAHLILQNGDKTAALDLQEGEIRAEAAITEARIRAQSEEESGFAGIVTSAIPSAIATEGVSLATLPLQAMALYDQVNAIGDMGNVEAQAARRLADIQAQKTRIQATERAQIQFEQRDETLYRTEEAMHDLMLQAERQKLNILLAGQKLDMENAKLANMTARVQFLLQEWQHAAELIAADPLTSADYRLIRDLTVRDAEESFIYAQEWSYLAAKAAKYRVNGARQAPTVDSLLKQILTARTGKQLKQRVMNLRSQIDSLYLGQGTGSPIQNAILSVRNFLVQNNYIVYKADGSIDGTASNLEQQAGGLTSDEAWLRFLRDHLVVDSRTGTTNLQFVFSTSLNRPTPSVLDPQQAIRNPLFDTTLFDALITYADLGSLPGAYGVRVNLRGRGLTVNPALDQILVDLRQEGASVIRSFAWITDTDGSGLRVWNLEPVNGRVIASIDGFKNEPGTAQFHERSPANDRWIFTISYLNGANSKVINQLDKLTDIEIAFSIRGFSGF